MKLSRRQLLAGVTSLVGGAAAYVGYVELHSDPPSRPLRRSSRSVAALTTAQAQAAARPGSLSRMAVRDATGRLNPVLIWRPPGADSAQIPVVYFLHGVPGLSTDLVNSGIVAATAAAVSHGVGPLVLVMPDGNGHRKDTEWADATDGKDLVASRLTTFVLPAVEGRFPRQRGRRALVGFSMGGYGAANLSLQNTELFCQWASIDGYFKVDDPDHVFATPAARIANSPDLQVANGTSQRALLIEGKAVKGRLVPGEAARMAGLLTAVGAPATVWTPPGGHSWTFVRQEWTPMLAWLKAGWSATP